MGKLAIRHSCLVAGLFVAIVFQRASIEAQEHSLRAVYNALGGVMAPIWVAADAGLFTKHGVNVDLKYLAATSAVQAMVGGGEEVGLVGNQGVDAKLEGAELTYVAGGLPTFVFQLILPARDQIAGGLERQDHRGDPAGRFHGLCHTYPAQEEWFRAG